MKNTIKKFLLIFLILIGIPQVSAQTTQKEYKAYNFEAYYYEDQVTVCWMFQERLGNSFIRVYSTDNFNLYSNGEKIPYRTDGKISKTKNNGGQKTYCVRYFYDDYNNFYSKRYENLSFKENSIFLFSSQEKINVQIDSSSIINHNQTAREIIAYNKLRPERRKIPESDFIPIPLPVIRGCTNSQATNYNPKANKDDGSCKLPIRGCTDNQAVNYNAQATEDDGSCQARVEGCTDPTATNYNANANVHMEDQCVYPPPPPPAYVPQDITGYISTEQVQSGATSWTSTLTVNMTGAILNYNKIQTWEQFTPVSATTEDNRIIITFRQFDDQRLDVECTNYEYTIPREAIVTANGDKNINPITGNFTVVGCDTKNQDNSSNYSTGSISIKNAELNKKSKYLDLISYKDGTYYANMGSFLYLFLYLILGFTFIYILFKLLGRK